MINFYDFIRSEPSFTKLTCNELLFVEYNCPLGDQSMRVWSEQNFLLYVLDGEKTLSDTEQTWRLRAGDALFVKKGAFTIQPVRSSHFCVLLFFVPDEFIRDLLQEHHLEGIPGDPQSTGNIMSLEVDPALGGFFQSVLPYFNRSVHPPSSLLELKFRELILNILFSPRNQQLAHFFRSLAAAERAVCLRSVMEENFRYNLSLEEFARLCHRSLSSFKRDFKTTFSTPPGKWLLNRRLELARRLLLASQESVTEIACESGFQDDTHFIRVFKEKYGLPPLKYRREQAATTG